MNKININHIVLSGGAYLGLYEIGALKYLNEKGFYNLDAIKTIHGTSIGGLIGCIMCLNMEWSILYDYFIKRPWFKMIQMTPNMFFDVIPNKGLLGYSFFENALSPLFKSMDIQTNITLLDFYELTKKELYLYTVDINKYELVQLSFKSHPDLELIKAIQMTCSLPYMFQPVWYNNTYYIDGGLINNYPLDVCHKMIMVELENKIEKQYQEEKQEQETCKLQDEDCEKNNIFGELETTPGEKKLLNNENETNNINETSNECNNVVSDTILGIHFDLKNETEILKETSNVFEYGYFLYRKMVKTVRNTNEKPKIQYEMLIPCEPINMKEGYNVLMNDESRKKYLEDGENYAKLFLRYKCQNV